MTIVNGKYEKINGVIFLYTDNTLYTIISPNNWGSVEVGKQTFCGMLLDEETFEDWKSECTQEGTFVLQD